MVAVAAAAVVVILVRERPSSSQACYRHWRAVEEDGGSGCIVFSMHDWII